MSKKNTTRFALDPKQPPKLSKSQAARLDALSDSAIDYSDIPELNSDFWKFVTVLRPSSKQMLSFRVDKDVIDWFKHQGKGYQSYMNAVLRSFVETQKRS